MAIPPRRSTRISRSEDSDYHELGVKGRKTGIELPDTGERDEHGMQPVEGLFSSEEEGESSGDGMKDEKQRVKRRSQTEPEPIDGENTSGAQSPPDNKKSGPVMKRYTRKRDADQLESESEEELKLATNTSHYENAKRRMETAHKVPRRRSSIQTRRNSERQSRPRKTGRTPRSANHNLHPMTTEEQ